MLPNLKCGGVVVNEFRAMRGRKRGSLRKGPSVRIPLPPLESPQTLGPSRRRRRINRIRDQR